MRIRESGEEPSVRWRAPQPPQPTQRGGCAHTASAACTHRAAAAVDVERVGAVVYAVEHDAVVEEALTSLLGSTAACATAGSTASERMTLPRRRVADEGGSRT